MTTKNGNGSSGSKAVRAPRARPSGSSLGDPLVPFQVWKIRRSTVEELQRGATEKGWFTAALVRRILDEWAGKRRARTGKREGKAA